MRFAVLVVVAICCSALAGCFEWTEDQSGNLQSVGIPGVPFWQAKKPAPVPQSLTDTGMTPEAAAKMSGPVLVLPPDQSSTDTRYRYYQTGENTCQQDLAKMLADRAANNETGPAPYCTRTPNAPPAKGTAFVF